MIVIKRNGDKVEFDKDKIFNAILKAYNEVNPSNDNVSNALNDCIKVCDSITAQEISVEQIQDVVEDVLMESDKAVAKAYITYRYRRELARRSHTTDDEILSIIDYTNEEVKEENSNKNPRIIPTQRDYIAGAVSKDLTQRVFLPKEIIDAHNNGLIHFHDADYFIQKCFNCDLVNLEDMLQNGTVISGTMIEKPHSFATACTIATQIIAQVASSQYGGQSISIAHLAPFVQISREKIRKAVIEEAKELGGSLDEKVIDSVVEKRLRKEIASGVQTIQYQVVTLLTTNGQAPFITIFMYLGEVKDPKTKQDLALVIEEIIKQRYQGVKNESGVWITPAFPKLIYVLEEDNIRESSPYYYLTKLAAKCSAKRLVPDYISEKKMKELKEGNCFPVMGCVDGKEIITYKYHNRLYVESFERMWDRLAKYFPVLHQYSDDNPNLYIKLNDVFIYDTEKGFVNTQKIIRNISNQWLDVKMSNGRRLLCTPDHPFHTNRGRILAQNLELGDIVQINSNQYSEENIVIEDGLAWMLGFMLCDGCYQKTIFASIAATGEDEIAEKFTLCMKRYFNLDVKEVLQERGKKGTYNDLIAKTNELDDGRIVKSIAYFISLFGGVNKNNRHIPNEVFEWNYSAKLSFLAGMIDADGYINNTSSASIVQIGSTNKELALQQLALAQTLGMPARLYHNHYNSRNKDLIRYRIEFYPATELISYIQCEKKKNNYAECDTPDFNITANILEITPIDKSMFSYDVTTDSDHFEVSGIYSHNCRSALSPWKDENGNYKFYGRFNKGVVTINLVDVACSSGKDMDKFWKIFDERLELCHEALIYRYKRLKGTPSDVAPILWQYGAISRLKKGETIDKLLVGGYSSISLGYAGLCECVRYMTGKPHTDPSATPFAIEVMKHMNDKCTEWNEQLNLGFGLYGTPLEATTYKFAKCLQDRFGIIEGVTDKNYITNSYHIHVTEPINAFDKLAFESQFQSLSTGGAISYVETSNLQNNIPAVLEVIKYIYDNIMYAELNTKSDYCQVCGYDGEIQIVTDNKSNKLVWECPNCGNRDENKLNVARRTCGYIGSNFWNQGRTQEIKERVIHLGGNE